MTQKFFNFMTGFALMAAACVEAPPSVSNSQNPTNNATNNATNIGTNNNTNTNPEFEPFTTSDGLALLFLFEDPLVEPLYVKNHAPAFAQRRLQLPEAATIQNGRLSLNRQTALVTLPEQVLDAAVASGEFSAEFWWEHSGSDSGTLLKLSDSIFIQRNGRNQISIRLGPDNFSLRDVDLGPMSHLVLTSNADSMKLYVDGFLVWGRAQATESLNALTLMPAIELGSRNGAFIDIQQFAFYTRALTQAEVAMHTVVGPGNWTRQPSRNDTFALAFRDSSTHNNVLKRIVQTSVREGQDKVDRLDFYPEDNIAAPLLWLNHDLSELPSDARLLHGYVRLESTTLTTESPNQPFQLRAFQLLRPWDPLTVAWNSPWTEAGVTGAADRAEVPFYTSPETFSFPTVEVLNTARFLIDTTNLLDSWLNGTNYGMLLDAEGIGRGSLSNEEHLRAGFVVLGIGTPPSVSFPPIVLRADTLNQCFVEHEDVLPATMALEVWQNKNLVAVSSGSSIPVRNCTDPSTLQVSAVDVFGKAYWDLDVSQD